MTDVQDGAATRLVTIPENVSLDIVAHTFCRRVRVQENYTSDAGATTDLLMAIPSGADQVLILKGTPAVFTAPGPNGSYSPGTVVGSVQSTTADAELECQQIEDQLI